MNLYVVIYFTGSTELWCTNVTADNMVQAATAATSHEEAPTEYNGLKIYQVS